MNQCYRIVGGKTGRRTPVSFKLVWEAYKQTTHEAECDREAYLSAFNYGPDFLAHVRANQGSVAGYAGPCHSPYIWIDIDSKDQALDDARKLYGVIVERYGYSPLIFFSGSKGYHFGVSSALFNANAPSIDFNVRAKHVAMLLAEQAGVGVDASVYDRTRAFRAPNSRHPATGLYKRHLGERELLTLSNEEIRELAREPAPFEDPPTPEPHPTAIADWNSLPPTHTTNTPTEAVRERINQCTREYIFAPPDKGSRHPLLFSASANLAEIGLTPSQIFAIVGESARESGLSPSDIKRQIQCGYERGRPRD